jgi:hypothetical protein
MDEDVMFIWEQWLVPIQPRVLYSKFQHFEFEERSAARAQIQNDLAALVYSYHTHSHTDLALLSSLGYPLVAHAMTGDQRPRATNPDTCKAHLAEILACEYARTRGYEVPVLRLRYNPNPDQSMKGDDILGFQFASPSSGTDSVLVGEAKYRGAYRSEVVQQACDALQAGFRPYPASMEFVAAILDLQGDGAKASRVRQVQARMRSDPSRVHRARLLFLATEGRPTDPFRIIEDKVNVPLNLLAINVSFQEGIEDWISVLYGQEVVW